ncbi:RND transporter [Planctomycetaceae bacterium SH139]
MKLRSSVSIMFAGLFAAATLTFTGCSDSATVTPVAEDAESAEPAGDEHAAGSHQHGAWWCGEHGVPEEECARCDKSLVAKFKAAGDWCEQDNRPDSQCFVCHPENFEKFASLYEAKYGERPEMPVE